MISIASKAQQQEWDAYVEQHPQGSFCHLYGWRNVIADVLGHTSHYLFYKDENSNVVGILPLIEMKSKLFGHTLVSTPFCMYGGAIADSAEIQAALEEQAKILATQLNVDYLELRYQSRQAGLSENGFMEKSVHSYFSSAIADNDDEILLSIKKKQRAVVRHSLKNDLSVCVDQDIDKLYRIYSISVRNLGTPVFSKKLFKGLLSEFGQDVDVLTVSDGNEALSSVMSFYFKDMVMPYYGGGTEQARATKSNDHMYYQLMCHARQKGKKLFDFGRSKNDSGAHKYKRSWGMDSNPLYHYFFLVKAKEMPNLSPNNPKYKLLISCWQKLPLWVSQFLGPYLSKYLG